MCSVHANSAREAVVKLCTLPLLAGENVTDVSSWCRPWRPASTWWCRSASNRTAPGGSGRSSRCQAGSRAAVVETEDIFTTRDGRLVRAQGFPPHADRFERHGIDLAALLAVR